MNLPLVIDKVHHRLADSLNQLLTRSVKRPVDIFTAYFSLSGYRLVKDGLHGVGSFRLLIGSDPQSDTDVGLKPR